MIAKSSYVINVAIYTLEEGIMGRFLYMDVHSFRMGEGYQFNNSNRAACIILEDLKRALNEIDKAIAIKQE